MGLREEVADAIRLLYARGLVSLRGGNVSTYDESHRVIYITPTGKPRHRIGPSDIAVIDPDGRVLEGRPSSEWRLHVEVYKRIPQARAVAHAHPPLAVAAAAAGAPLETSLLLEAAYSLGECGRIPVAPRRPPGTWELARATVDALVEGGCRGAVMEGHGAVAWGEDVYRAVDAIEALEDLARVAVAVAVLTCRRPL